MSIFAIKSQRRSSTDLSLDFHYLMIIIRHYSFIHAGFVCNNIRYQIYSLYLYQEILRLENIITEIP